MVEEDSDSRFMLEMLNHFKVVEAATGTAIRQVEVFEVFEVDEADEANEGVVVVAVVTVV
jgi:hypothetical protein